jgi:cobalamin-dependent methionine synthase I
MLHPAVILSEDRVIHGKGLVASAPIRKGEIVSHLEAGLPTLYIADVMAMPFDEQETLLRYGYQRSDDQIVIEKEPERFMNHSCDANTEWIDIDTMIASRDIQEGEELTYDYATTEITIPYEFECQCGAPACRHHVTNLDYLLPDWQARYGDFLPLHTLRAIAKAASTS